MTSEGAQPTTSSSTVTQEHLAEARQKARQALGGEVHLGHVDDWRLALGSAKDTIILLGLTWAALRGLGLPAHGDWLLVCVAVGVSLLTGISTGRAVFAQAQYYAGELERERSEIQNHREHELEEVRLLYAAKGFEGAFLEQIVETLGADDDRLLRVMMEEELGLGMHHMNHPLLVGMWNMLGSLAAGLILCLPLFWLSAEIATAWLPAAGVALLFLLAAMGSLTTERRWVTILGDSLITAVVTAGVAFFLAQWLSSAAISFVPLG